MIGKFLKASFAHRTNCVEESQVSTESVDKFWNHDHTGENDQNLKCYLKCAFIKTHIIDENGVLLVDHLLHDNGIMHQLILSHPDLLTKVIDFCKNPKANTDLCQSAYDLVTCGFQKVMELS